MTDRPDAPRTAAEAAEALRTAFDATFAAPAGTPAALLERLLAVRVNGDPWALRLVDLAYLAADVKVVPVPTTSAGMLGLAGIRGMSVPVHDLAVSLGYDGRGGGAVPRWLAVSGAWTEAPVALAFEALDRYLDVPRASVRRAGAGATTRAFARHVVEIGAEVRWVVDVPSVAEAFRRAARPVAGAKEGA